MVKQKTPVYIGAFLFVMFYTKGKKSTKRKRNGKAKTPVYIGAFLFVMFYTKEKEKYQKKKKW